MQGTCNKIMDGPCYETDKKSQKFSTAAPNCFDSSSQNNEWTRRAIKLSAAEVLFWLLRVSYWSIFLTMTNLTR